MSDLKVWKFQGVSDAGELDIKRAMSLAEEEKHDYLKHKKLYALAEEDLAYVLRHTVAYPWFDTFIDEAQEWLRIISDNYDRRKKYVEQDSWIQLNKQLQQALDIKHLEVWKITTVGYDTQEYILHFITDSDYVFYMSVPRIKVLTAKNMKELQYGKIRFGYLKDRSFYKGVAASYDVSTFKSNMYAITTSEEYKEHYSRVDFGYMPTWLKEETDSEHN